MILAMRERGLDARFGGLGFISGTLRRNGTPFAGRIYLTERTTYRVVAVTFSGPDGTYRIDGLNPAIEFDLRAQDWARTRRDEVLSAVKPSTV